MSRLGILLVVLLALASVACRDDARGALPLPTIDVDTIAVNDLIEQAKTYVGTDIPRADSLARSALTLLDSVNHPEGLASCLIVMSYIKLKTGDLDTGFEYESRATRISEELGDPKLLAECYNQRYLLYFQRGDYDSATIAAEKSFAMAESIAYQSMIARGHQNFGILNSVRGNHSKAIEHFLESEKYYQLLGDTLALAFLLGNLGVTFEEAGNLDKALEYMHKERSISTKIKNKNLQAWSLTNIGSVHSMLGHRDSALHYYSKSLRISEATKNPDLLITNYDNIGSYWSATGQFDSATHYLMAALNLAKEAGFSYQEVYVIGHIAENYFAMGKLDSALIYGEMQLELARDQGLQVDQKLAYAFIAKTRQHRHEYRNALEAMTNYVALNDSLYNEEKARLVEELRENYEAEKKDQQISALKQQQEAEAFKRNTYVFSGIVIIIFLVLLYNRQRLVARKNRQLVQKGQEVERMKSRFFANISHEFRTPLTLILGPIETLNASVNDVQLKSQLEIMRKNASRMLTLTNQLLDLSKLEAGSLRLAASQRDIVPLVKGVVMSFDTMAEIKNISLVTAFKDNHLEVCFDVEKIETVVINLLSNALKFTPGGGTVTVSQESDDRCCLIAVSDTGEGISEHDIAHVFDRFYQGTQQKDNVSQGGATGIGLALAKELVELHCGEIEVKSVPDSGTTVSFVLPLGTAHLATDDIVHDIPDQESNDYHSPSSAEGYDSHELLSPVSPGKPLLLLIEDNNDVMAYIKTILRDQYEIAEAYDGEHGIRLAIEIIPDLIVCDVMMPLKNGYEVCAALKHDEKTSHIPLILLTARSSSEDRVQGLRQAADDYVTKPFVPQELEARIANLIYSRQQLREKFNRHVLLMPEETELTSIDEHFLTRVKNAIEANIGNEHFSVDQLGREVGMSRSQIHRKLRALTNQSASQFIRSFRLARAKSMIEQDAGTISEIAYSVGFASPSYFSRCFLQHFGCTPTDLKSGTQITDTTQADYPLIKK